MNRQEAHISSGNGSHRPAQPPGQFGGVRIRLGVVCPRRSRETFEVASASLSGVVPRWACYEDEAEVRSEVEAILPDVDAVCFSGHLPWDRAKDLLGADLPTSIVQLTSTDLALCLLRARDAGLPSAPMSVDTVDAPLLEELAAELGIDAASIAHDPYDASTSADDVFAFHRRAHADLGTVFAITGRSNAAAPMRAGLGIPVFEAVPIVSSVRAAMNRAALSAVSHRYASLQFAAAVFRVVTTSGLMESEVQRLTLARALHESNDLRDAWVEARSGGKDVLVFANKGLMQRASRDWTSVPLLRDIQQSLGVQIAVGFGLGNSARHSVEYAEVAVRRAARDGGGCAYLLSEDGVVIGPMSGDGETLPARHRFKTNDGRVAALASRLGLSIGTVSQLLAYERKLASEAVSAADIGRELRLTPPSGRRIVRTLQSHGVIARIGTSQVSGRGRPASLYRLELERALGPSAESA